jgi:PBP1b-binding outer membrane lipoprotein LpoB
MSIQQLPEFPEKNFEIVDIIGRWYPTRDLRRQSMKRSHSILMAILVVALVLGGCAKPPTAEATAARAAVSKAEQNPDVPVYAPDTLRKAKDALAAMESALTKKKYDQATTSAGEAKVLAEKAPGEAATAKANAKASATSLIADLPAAIAALEKNIAQARKTKAATEAAAVATEIPALKAALITAQKNLTDGNFLKARDAALALQSKIGELEARIAAAVAATSKKK